MGGWLTSNSGGVSHVAIFPGANQLVPRNVYSNSLHSQTPDNLLQHNARFTFND